MSSFEEPKTPNNNNDIIKPKNTIFTTPRWPSSSRTSNNNTLLSPSPSFSSNSSSSFISSFSNEENSPTQSPSQRIPFSWETIPGIPKQQIIIKTLDNSSMNSSTNTINNLPLPPAAVSFPCNTTKPYCMKNHIVGSNKDPFFAAFVECSKRGDQEDQHRDTFGSISKCLAKSLRHRFGLVKFSCKKTYVDDSLVFLPREHPRRISYGMVKKRSG